MFLLVPAYPGSPGQTAIKWLLLLFFVNKLILYIFKIHSFTDRRFLLMHKTDYARKKKIKGTAL